MEIRLSMELAKYLGEEKLRSIGIEWRGRFGDYFDITLGGLTLAQIRTLRGWLVECPITGSSGAKLAIRDIDTWLKALADAGGQKSRTVRHFASLITEYLRRVPGHRIYTRLDNEGMATVAYYVDIITYHPEQRSRDSYYPAYTTIRLLYIEFGERRTRTATFNSEDIFGKTASEALAKAGYFIETPEMRTAYLAETDRFNEVAPRLGTQFTAQGSGTADLDGNEGVRNWSRYSSDRYPLNNTKVVIDVFYEKEASGNRGGKAEFLDKTFWSRKTPKEVVEGDEEEKVYEEDLTAEETTSKAEVIIEVPVHPFCAVFDLRRHLRLRVHVNYLTEYVYDQHMGAKLILPQVTKDLVATLINESRTGFSDIIEGKGLGVCVLLGGPPGVGKTLTAEVFSEASQRPLYSIQAAQLGIKADAIEDNLSRFLARGSRWNAMVLIDEADVYIAARDRDMEHNAIVASFLRILEYQSAILFMTTNMASSVDDALVSRCLALISYRTPDIAEQTKIWRVLADLNNVPLSDEAIELIVKRHPTLAGRDIKQLLKLAVLHASKTKEGITPDVIDFVSQFQPTIRFTSQYRAPLKTTAKETK